jgi:hypothetical protein
VICKEIKFFLCASVEQEFLVFGDVSIDVLKQTVIPNSRCIINGAKFDLETNGGELFEVSAIKPLYWSTKHKRRIPQCQ